MTTSRTNNRFLASSLGTTDNATETTLKDIEEILGSGGLATNAIITDINFTTSQTDPLNVTGSLTTTNKQNSIDVRAQPNIELVTGKLETLWASNLQGQRNAADLLFHCDERINNGAIRTYETHGINVELPNFLSEYIRVTRFYLPHGPVLCEWKINNHNQPTKDVSVLCGLRDFNFNMVAGWRIIQGTTNVLQTEYVTYTDLGGTHTLVKGAVDWLDPLDGTGESGYNFGEDFSNLTLFIWYDGFQAVFGIYANQHQPVVVAIENLFNTPKSLNIGYSRGGVRQMYAVSRDDASGATNPEVVLHSMAAYAPRPISLHAKKTAGGVTTINIAETIFMVIRINQLSAQYRGNIQMLFASFASDKICRVKCYYGLDNTDAAVVGGAYIPFDNAQVNVTAASHGATRVVMDTIVSGQKDVNLTEHIDWKLMNWNYNVDETSHLIFTGSNLETLTLVLDWAMTWAQF